MKTSPRYFVGTDGRITVWRRSTELTYRSAIISEFRVQFRQARPSGPNAYPVEQIGREEYDRLVKARGTLSDDRRGTKADSWIENRHLPVDLVLPIPTGEPEETEDALLRGLVAT